MTQDTTPTKPLEVSPRDYHTRLTCNRADIFDHNSFLSKSVLWELNESSLYRWRHNPKDQAEVAAKIAVQDGTIIDCLITTPEEIDDITAVHDYPDFRSEEARDFRDDALAAGRVPVSREKMGEYNRAARMFFTHPTVGPIVKASRKQVICIGTVCEIQSKCLVDIDGGESPVLWDIKRTARLSKDKLEKTISDFGYYIQSAWYLHLWNQQHPDRLKDRFGFLWQCSEPPYEIVATELPSFDIEAGRDWIRYHCEKLKTATETGHWPGIFGDRITMLGRPGYAAMKDEFLYDEPVAAPAILPI